MTRIAGEIEASHGQIALAFLNAGVYFIAERDRFSADLVRRTFEINVGGTVNCLDPVLATMQRRGKGQIALNASLAGYGGIEGSVAYGATKAALIYMAEALKLTYERAGLTIQIVSPGFVHTEMTAQNDFRDAFHHGRGPGGQDYLQRIRKERLRNQPFRAGLPICSRPCASCLILCIFGRCGARRSGRGGDPRALTLAKSSRRSPHDREA